MSFYIGITAILLISSLLENISYETIFRKKYAIFLLCVFAFLSSIRWKVGTDWYPYWIYFVQVSKNLVRTVWVGDYEIGYRILNVIVKNFTTNYTVLLSVIAIIILVFDSKGILFYADKNNEYIGIYSKSCFVTQILALWCIYFGNIFAVRATIALSILFFSSKYIFTGDWKKFIFFVLLATSFHSSSILFLFSYCVRFNMAIFKKLYKYCIPLSVVGVLIGNSLIKIIGLISPGWQYRVEFYSSANSNLSAGYTGLINYLFLYFVFVFIYYFFQNENENYRRLLNVYCMGLIPYAIGTFMNSVYIRAAQPFMIFSIVLLPQVIQVFKDIKSRTIASIIVYVYLIMRLYSNLNGMDSELYIPFLTIFSK